MKKMLAVSVCLIVISLFFTGCSVQSASEQPQQQQTVEIDTAKLDEAVDKLVKATEQLEEASKNYKEAVENKNTNSNPSAVRATLVLCMDPAAESISDRTQTRVALSKGGMLIMKGFSAEAVDRVFPEDVYYYGAPNEAGYSFTCGDVLNYIASFGWEIESTMNVGAASYYYFSKRLDELPGQM